MPKRTAYYYLLSIITLTADRFSVAESLTLLKNLLNISSSTNESPACPCLHFQICEVLGRCEAVIVNDKARCPEIPVDPALIEDDDEL